MVVPIMLATTTLRRLDVGAGVPAAMLKLAALPLPLGGTARSSGRVRWEDGAPGAPCHPGFPAGEDRNERRGSGEVLRQLRARRGGQAGQMAVVVVAAADHDGDRRVAEL